MCESIDRNLLTDKMHNKIIATCESNLLTDKCTVKSSPMSIGINLLIAGMHSKKSSPNVCVCVCVCARIDRNLLTAGMHSKIIA
jgi:hypothetical protein